MRIALVSPYDLAVVGGVNIHITYLAEHFRALGLTVRVIGPSSGPPVMGTEPDVIALGWPRLVGIALLAVGAALSLRK